MSLRLAFLILLVPLGRAVAADEPAATAPTGGDSISAAKRDFDTIKAARDSGLQQKGDLPRFSVPELQTEPTAPRTMKMTKEEEARLKKKSNNWLLDAMEKKPAPMKGQEKAAAEKAEEMRLLLQPQKETEPGELAVVAAERPAPAEKERKGESPPNPLNPFLAGWMTTQDYALLKPGLQATNGGGAVVSTAALAPSALPMDMPAARDDLTAALAGPDRAAFTAPKSAENPYLQTLNEPAPLASFTPPLPSTAVSAPSSPAPSVYVPIATPPPPPPSSRLPDFAKPATDDKYFKPLKRF